MRGRQDAAVFVFIGDSTDRLLPGIPAPICADYKGQFRMGNGRLCYPLTISDNYSRYLLDCQGLVHPKLEQTKPHFEWHFGIMVYHKLSGRIMVFLLPLPGQVGYPDYRSGSFSWVLNRKEYYQAARSKMGGTKGCTRH
jgi:hypothetical protein